MEDLLQLAKKTLRIEAEAILAMEARLDQQFTLAVDLLFACAGRVVVCGMGKSGLIGKKIAATLASTGTPAFFLHPAEGSHGDLGMVTKRDVVLAISNSGETGEVLTILPPIKRLGLKLIGMTGKPESTLGRMSEVVLDIGVALEACPMGLAPTSSTTAALAMGDALAVCLLEKRGFAPDQFALLHPGGSLGKKLLLRVADLMHQGAELPLVHGEDTVREAIMEITAKRFGTTGVTDPDGRLIGIITDGDLRRHLEDHDRLPDRRAHEIMTANPKTIRADALAVEAISQMQDRKISSLFILETGKKPIGIIHLHDLLAAGLM